MFTPVPAGNCAGTCFASTGCVPPTPCTGTCAPGPCFRAAACTSSVCVFSNPMTCDDGNVCTTDTCNPATGCVYTPFTCDQSASACFPSTCSSDGKASPSPNCKVGATPKACSDNNACTDDSCVDPQGCVFTNYTCAASSVPCSFQSGCDGLGLAQPNCIIANYSCGLSAAAVAGISVGVIVGVTIAAIVAALLALFLSKKGYDY